jgi:hypothetical protein
MLGDGAIRSWWNKDGPRNAGEPKPAANDPLFTEVLSDFSRRLSERTAEKADPAAAARQRRAALKAYDSTRRRQLILVGGFGVGALVGLALAMIAPPVSAPPLEPAVASAIASMAATPAAEPPLPIAKASVDEAPPKMDPVATAEPAAAEPAAAATLRGEEVREVQTKLRGFGFNAGPPDGVVGRMTLAAAEQYQQARGLPQTGKIDSELLEQLRQDPAPQVAPQVAQRAPRQPVRAGTATARRGSDPFQRLGQWLDSLVR